MKFQHVLLACILSLVFNCSISDDSDDDDFQLPEASSSFIIDEGMATETIFNDVIPQGNSGCISISMAHNTLIKNNLEINEFIAIRDNYYGELNTIGPEEFLIRFKINGITFTETSGDFTVTKYVEIDIDGVRHFIISGSVNAIMSPNNSNTGEVDRTINFTFENILSTNLGVAC